MIDFFAGAVVGFLLGLVVAYWSKITAVVQNRDKISAASNFVDASTGLASAFGLKL